MVRTASEGRRNSIESVSYFLDLGRWRLNLDRPRVMGILNVTPDSFSDGGCFVSPDAAIGHARRMIEAGADLVDVGGASSRPGAVPVPIGQELDRVLPVIEALARDVPVSIDTTHPEVMRAAVQTGAVLVNDIAALREPDALGAVAELGVAVCLMHMQGTPADMQQAPHYVDVVTEVRDFLAERVAACQAAGIGRERLSIDPGFGFGKTLVHNLALLRGLGRLRDVGVPILAGLSRKSMIGQIAGGGGPEGRLQGSVAAALVAVLNGASIVRVHDVRETVEALAVWNAVQGEEG